MRERLQARLATAGLTLEMDTTCTLKVRVDAAESRPGVGLGLALSRRLAKSLGGGLKCVDSPKGARFVLQLPIV